MNAIAKRVIVWLGIVFVLSVALLWLLWPRAIQVDLAVVSSGPLVVTIEEQGETRVKNTFEVSAPVTGHVKRIEVEAGDTVLANKTVVAEIEPLDPSLLDVRTQAQVRAAIVAAESAQTLATSRLAQAQAELDFTKAELARARRLRDENIIPIRDLDAAVRNERTADAALGTARAALAVSRAELEQTKAQLLTPTETEPLMDGCTCIPVLAVSDGRVLRVLRKSEGIVTAGEPLLELGDTSELEIVVDLLSADAVKVVPGQRVSLTQWGGNRELSGKVRRVDPYAQTRVSALGIEEKRVDVIIDLDTPVEHKTGLGHGYQVDVSIVLWESNNVISVPLTALFRVGQDWAMYVERDGMAFQQLVSLGKKNAVRAEITDGVKADERYVQYPSDRIHDRVRVTQRDTE